MEPFTARSRSLFVAATLAVSSLFLPACSGADDAVVDDTSETAEELSGSPDAINIGMNGGPDQFTYFEDFLKVSTVTQAGPRVCHTYVSWNIAKQKPGAGSTSEPGSRAWFESWIKAANGHCDEALISFKAVPTADNGTGTRIPSVAEFTSAFETFLTTKWGFTGKFAFTPWNEPNNGADSGDGLGDKIPADHAAELYLKMRRRCAPPGCKVAAGDFASNGGMVNDFKFNCPSDIVSESQLCKEASYLDRYKNYIANHADDKDPGAPHVLKKDFRPEYFAYHGWYDINTYVNEGNHCGDPNKCATRELLKNLGGSWSNVEIWDTEVGVGQDGEAALDQTEQACGAAFLVRITSKLSKRITRIYYTRMHGGNPTLFDGDKPKLALAVLADRRTSYPAKCR
jgi:hypothetical protein